MDSMVNNNFIIDLNTTFNDYKFYEKEHYYTYQGKKVKYSVTQFIDTKHKKFDRDSLSKYVAKRDNLSQEDVLKLWDTKAQLACNVGTLFHNRAEQLANNKVFNIDFSTYSNLPIIEDIKNKFNALIPLQDKFFQDIHNKLIPIKTEFTVGYKDIIAGNIDLLVWNVKYREFQIWDYKTNKEIKFINEYDEKLLDEFNTLDNCEFNKYSIQLNLYKELLQRGLNIKIGKCYLAWFNSNNENYQIFECLDLHNEVSAALDNLIRKEDGRIKTN